MDEFTDERINLDGIDKVWAALDELNRALRATEFWDHNWKMLVNRIRWRLVQLEEEAQRELGAAMAADIEGNAGKFLPVAFRTRGEGGAER